MKPAMFGLSALALLAFAAPSLAMDEGQTLPAPKGYERTGQYENCLTASRIEHSRILNRHQILFEMTGKEAYLAEPAKGQCPTLSRSYALVYDASINQLCNSSIIHLIEPSSPVSNRGTCGIDRFEKLVKTPKAK